MSVISGIEEVETYISLNLVKVAIDQSGWNTLYLNTIINQYWVLTYPNSEMHSGGQPQLQQVTELVAKKESGV